MERLEIINNSMDISNVPNIISILPLRNVSSQNGSFIVDEESFWLLKEQMQRRAIDIVIDYEHQTLKNVQAPAGGWIKDIMLQNNSIVAKVEWTEKAKAYLGNKEYRYLSPVVLVRKSDKKVVQLHSVALTNTPAINGMIPIVNSIGNVSKSIADNNIGSEMKQILELLNISLEDYIKYKK